MFQKITKKDYVNEILRLTKSLCQMKHDSESDRQIQENFAMISEIEKEEQKKREIRKERNLQNKLSACV